MYVYLKEILFDHFISKQKLCAYANLPVSRAALFKQSSYLEFVLDAIEVFFGRLQLNDEPLYPLIYCFLTRMLCPGYMVSKMVHSVPELVPWTIHLRLGCPDAIGR